MIIRMGAESRLLSYTDEEFVGPCIRIQDYSPCIRLGQLFTMHNTIWSLDLCSSRPSLPQNSISTVSCIHSIYGEKYMKNENHTKTIKLNTWFYIWLSVGKEKLQPKNNNMMINEK